MQAGRTDENYVAYMRPEKAIELIYRLGRNITVYATYSNHSPA